MNSHSTRTQRRQRLVIGLSALVLSLVPVVELTTRGLPDWHRSLEDQSVFQRPLTGLLQQLLTELLHSGNEKAVVCPDGELQYVPDIHYLTSPIQEEAVPAILDLAAQLEARGIQLVVMPVPLKPQLSEDTVIPHPGFRDFADRLSRHGVLVCDVLPLLAQMQRQGVPVFLHTDTHWRPEAMEAAGRELAAFIVREAGCEAGAQSYTLTRDTCTQHGDIYTMLRLVRPVSWLPEEEVCLHPVRNQRGEYWQSQTDAPILFLGDSFSNIYSLDAMGWGHSGGLAEQLSYCLQQPITALRRNDNGSLATREMLQREMARGKDLLEGKRVVVWEFAARELTQGNWKPVRLVLGQPSTTGTFVCLGQGERRTLTGIVEAVSATPDPGQVNYADHVVAIHLTNIGEQHEEALVYALAMRNRELTPAAHLRAGDEITVEAESWAVHEAVEGAYTRNELDNADLLLEQPVWAVHIHRKP